MGSTTYFVRRSQRPSVFHDFMTINDLELEASQPGLEVSGHPLRRNLESKAIRGTYFVVIAYGCAMGLRLLSNIVLSHIFAPAFFGLISLMSTVIIGLTLFSHIGLEDSIIQNARGDDPVFLNTAWTMQVLRGNLVWILTLALAWPIARFYHEPSMVMLLPVLGLTGIIAGFSSPSLLTLARHIGVGRLTSLELFSQLIQFLVTLAWALLQPSIWALVAGRVVSELARTVASYWLLPEIRPRFAWEAKSVHALLSFGKWILIGTALTFLALQSDRLILAKLISLQMLGVYGIAFTLSDVPRQVILQFCSRVGFPFVAKFTHLPRPEFRTIFLKYRLPVLVVGGLMLIAVTATGDLFILHVYTKPYHAAAWMIGIFAIGLWHTMLYGTTGPAIMSLQKPQYNALAYFIYCISLFVLLPLGFHLWGMVGAVTAVAISDLPMYFVIAISAAREGIGTWKQDALLTLAFFSVLGLVLLGRHSLGLGWPFPGIPLS